MLRIPSKTRRDSLVADANSHSRSRARSVILTKRVPTLWTLVKHSLSLVRASQLHGVKVQSLVFALGTLFIHRRALSRHVTMVAGLLDRLAASWLSRVQPASLSDFIP